MNLTTRVFAIRRNVDATITATIAPRTSSVFAQMLRCALMGMVLSGCGAKGPPISVVTASVSLDGKPLTDGRVCVVSASGFGAAARLGPDGQVQLISQHGAGIPLGEYKVTVGPYLDARRILETMPSSEPKNLPPAAERPAVIAIPEKYWSPNTSDLSATVTDERHHFSFALKTSAQKP